MAKFHTFLQCSSALVFVGALPLRGTIPDMTSDSDRYIQLQQVYRDQADKDVAIVTQKVHDLLQNIGRVGGGVRHEA